MDSFRGTQCLLAKAFDGEDKLRQGFSDWRLGPERIHHQAGLYLKIHLAIQLLEESCALVRG